MRRIFLPGLITLLMIAPFAAAAQAPAEFKLCGRIGATDQEAQEGYFAVNNQTMIVVKPGSDGHTYLKGKVGQRACLAITPDTEPTE